MARPKGKWHGELRGAQIHAEGGSVIYQVAVREDPGRVIEVAVPRSRVDSMMSATYNAAVRIDNERAKNATNKYY